MLRTAFALALGAVAVAAAPAGAVTASYTPGAGLSIQGTDSPEAAIQSATDDLTSFVVHDGGTSATVEPGPGCFRATVAYVGSAGQARPVVQCPIPQPSGPADRNVTANLAGGDDFYGGAAFTGIPVTTNVYDGGPGNDVLIGLLAPETIRGGDGDDRISGGANDDRLEGGAGNDRFNPGPGTNTVLGEAGDDTLDEPADGGSFGVALDTSGADTFNGGPGRDTIGYQRRTAAVTVSPSAPDGQANENDVIGGDVEVVIGGAGPDKLSATSSAPVTLRGGAGIDSFQGTRTAETIEARDGESDSIKCGGGDDSLDADLKDKIPSDCPKVTKGAVDEGPNVSIRTTRAKAGNGGLVRIRLACPRAVGSIGCKGGLRLRGSGTGARAAYSIRAGRAATVEVTLAARDLPRVGARARALRVLSIERGRRGDKTTIAPLTVSG